MSDDADLFGTYNTDDNREEIDEYYVKEISIELRCIFSDNLPMKKRQKRVS